MAHHVLRDGGLADINAELEEFTMNSRSTPEGIISRHLPDEITDFLVDLSSARPPRSALPSPVQSESPAVPPNDGVRLDHDQPTSPVGPNSRQDDPQGSISIRQAGSFGIPLEDIELMTECEVLQDQCTVGL